MNKHLIFLLFIISLCLTPSSHAARQLPIDPNVRIGTLPNGLTYYIRHNEWPENRADFFIAQRVGSVNEEERQRGLAHFLEHMCFNGTKHFPGNSLISYLESIGVKFGANLNAYTSTDETVYNICEVPAGRSSALDSCFLILRDWSHDLLLRDEDIDAERGVIKGEWRQRNGSANNRLLEKAAPVIYRGSLYGQRLPIGLMSVVENFKYDELRDYYHRWYHPENQCIIVVGDIDPDYAESAIKRLWSDIARPSHDATPIPCPVPDNKEIIATVQTDPEQSLPMIQLYVKHADIEADKENTVDELRYDLIRELVCSMLAERYDDIERQSNAPFANLGIGDKKFLISRTQQALLVRANAKPGRETDCVKAFAAELKRAAEHGFLPTELQRAKLDFQSKTDSEFANREKITNTVYARRYVRHYLDGGALPSTEQYYKMMKGVINSVDTAKTNEYIRSVIRPDNYNVVLVAYMPEPKDGEPTITDADLSAAYSSVSGDTLMAYVDRHIDGNILGNEPVTGKIVREYSLDLFGAKVWELSNGIKVNLKHTDFQPDQILIQGYSPGGFSQNYDPQQAPDYLIANDVIDVSAFGNYTSTDLRRLITGKKVKVKAGVENMEETIGASTSPSDMLTAFQIIYLKATDIRRDDNAFKALIENKRMKLASQSSNPTFAMGDSIHSYVYGHHPLGKKLSMEDLDKVNYDNIISIYRNRFADMNDFTFYIIGNFNEDSLRNYVCRYIASLPTAGRMEKRADIGYRYVSGRQKMRFTCPMETPQTIAYTFYNAHCPYNLATVIHSHILGRIVQSRLMEDLRENRGWTYGVKCHCGISAGMNGSDSASVIMPVYIRVAPENADECFNIVSATVESMSDSSNISDDDILKVKQYMEKSYADNLSDNAYWLTVMRMYDKFGQDMNSDYRSILSKTTAEDISETARKYIIPANRIQLEMSPSNQ